MPAGESSPMPGEQRGRWDGSSRGAEPCGSGCAGREWSEARAWRASPSRTNASAGGLASAGTLARPSTLDRNSMPLRLTPGNSLVCKINAHRHGWNGQICSDPERWNCGAPAHFRSDYCANGDDRCFHVRTFAADDPRFVIEGNGGDWIFESDPHAFDDQILFFWGLRTSEDTGIPEGYLEQRHTLVGAYRVQSVERFQAGFSNRWIVRPYPDGWTEFGALHVKSARPEDAGGRYVKQIDRRDVERALATGDSAGSSWADAATVQRFHAFRERYPKWIERAAERARAFAPAPHADASTRSSSGGSYDLSRGGGGGLGHRPLRGLEALRPSVPSDVAKASTLVDAATAAPGSMSGTSATTPQASSPTTAAGSGPSVAAPSSGRGPSFLEEAVRERVETVYGNDVRTAIEVALATRDLVVLQGEPGVGKSYLALGLLDDPKRERTLVVPVAATWRGREDLLGYVNPIDGGFVSTPFTRFLERAAEAWRGGDRRTHLVVFEEFNLSQPEHWLADVLAVSQYEDEADRSIHLCQDPDGAAREVFLSPALRLVGTVNNDHTTRSLSPRVLDRAAVVALEIRPKEAMRRVELDDLDDDLVRAIDDLDDLLAPRGAAFSIRTARALKQCLAFGGDLTQGAAVDLVLAQQVLSKVDLSPHEPLDLRLVEQLGEWSGESGRILERCGALIERWNDLLSSGRDVRGA